MVSKASDDLPEPERPVSTTSRSRGISRSMFLRLCSRAPRMAMTRLSRPRRCLSNRSFIVSQLFEHDLVRKPVPIFRDLALGGLFESPGKVGRDSHGAAQRLVGT